MDNIRIGTRASKLAVWQAEQVQGLLQTINVSSSIIKIKSSGDKDLSKPVYELGITGVFTKEIDLALLNNKIDIAVHSLKDVPTKLPLGVMQGAVLQRGSELDVIIQNKALKSKENTIATGSLRRKAQWLNKFKTDNIVEIRGNVQTRLRKLNENNWNGTIMAKAGLERLGILPIDFQDLNWMVPAPAQGAISVQNLTLNSSIAEMLRQINHFETELCTNIERSFLNKLEGGCTAPIGAHAKIVNDSIVFRGVLLSVNGEDKIEINEVHKLEKTDDLGERLAKKIISQGGDRILNSLKSRS
jgi:hydroxymethylbilane synthase